MGGCACDLSSPGDLAQKAAGTAVTAQAEAYLGRIRPTQAHGGA